MVIDGASRRASSSSRSRAALRETEGLAASLLRDRAEVLRWKDENPLRLVAAALLDVERREMDRGRVSKKNLADKLVPVVIADWDNWWKVVQPALRDSQDFEYDKRSGTKPSRTAPSAIVPVTFSELSAASRKTRGDKLTWLDWLVSNGDVPMPKSPLRMNKKLAEELREQDAEIVPTIITNLCDEIEKRAFGANKSRKVSPGAWVKVFSAVLAHWSKPPTIPNVSTVKVVSLTARLKGVSELNQGDWESLVESLGSYTSVNVSNSQEIANAIIASSRTAPRETTALLEQIHGLLGELVRKDLWWRLIVADSGTSESGQISDWLNNRWRNIPDDEKTEVETSLIIASKDTDLIGNLNLMISGEWDFAGSERRQRLFNPILFGAFMRDALMTECRRILRELAEQVGKNGSTPRESAASATDSLMPYFEEFMAAAAKDRLKRQGDDYENKLAIEGGRLRDAEAELENTITRLTFLQRANRTKRTEATLEVTRDAIIVLGDALQGLAVSNVPRSREMGNLESKIVLALSTLDTRLLGEIGEVAPFNPKIHQSDYPPEIETPVKVVAPGLRYSRGDGVSAIVVPMKVQREE